MSRSRFSQQVSASKRQLQSLAGSLNFACRAVQGGRTFLRRVIDCVNRLRHSSHRCRLNSQFRADIKWWQQFLFTFNGRSMMLDFQHPVVSQTDASFLGYGAVCFDDWFAGSWAPSSPVDYNMSLYPHNWCTAGHAIDHSHRSNINFLELFPVLLAARHWDPRWSNKRVCVETSDDIYQQRISQKPAGYVLNARTLLAQRALQFSSLFASLTWST